MQPDQNFLDAISKLFDERFEANAIRFGLIPLPDDSDPDAIEVPVIEFAEDGWSIQHQAGSGACYSKGVAEIKAQVVDIARNDPDQRRKNLARRLLNHEHLNFPFGAKFTAKRLNNLKDVDPNAHADLLSSVSYADFRAEFIGAQFSNNKQDLPINGERLPKVIDYTVHTAPSGFTRRTRGDSYDALIVPNASGKNDKATAEWVARWVESVFEHGFHTGGNTGGFVAGTTFKG